MNQSYNNLVRPKKALGQHFLTDLNIARNIVDAMSDDVNVIVEVGAGMGVLTQYIIEDNLEKLRVVEIDTESIDYLKKVYPQLGDNLIHGDFLRTDLSKFASEKIGVIGNFPYNISSQIFFQVLKYRDQVDEVVGMIQKEVAERIAAGPGSKTYGILSVLLQAWYDIEYLFTVHENVFNPPPKETLDDQHGHDKRHHTAHHQHTDLDTGNRHTGQDKLQPLDGRSAQHGGDGHKEAELCTGRPTHTD